MIRAAVRDVGLTRLTLIVAVSAMLTAFLIWFDVLVHHWIVSVFAGAAVCLVMLLGVVVVRRGSTTVRPTMWAADVFEEHSAPTGTDYRLFRLQRDLRDATERDDRPDRIHALLTELADSRLNEVDGIDMSTSPEDAASVLGPQLFTYLQRPPTDHRRRSRKSIVAAITRLEEM